MSDINSLQEMFHNGCYAMCDDAVHTVAISMGYSMMRGVEARQSGLRESGRLADGASIGQGGGLAFPGPAQEAAGGKNRRPTEVLVFAPPHNPSTPAAHIFCSPETSLEIGRR